MVHCLSMSIQVCSTRCAVPGIITHVLVYKCILGKVIFKYALLTYTKGNIPFTENTDR